MAKKKPQKKKPAKKPARRKPAPQRPKAKPRKPQSKNRGIAMMGGDGSGGDPPPEALA